MLIFGLQARRRPSGRRLTATDDDGRRDFHHFIRTVLSLNCKRDRARTVVRRMRRMRVIRMTETE